MKVNLFKDFSYEHKKDFDLDEKVSMDVIIVTLSNPELEDVTGKHTKSICLDRLKAAFTFEPWFEQGQDIHLLSTIEFENVNNSLHLKIGLCENEKDSFFSKLSSIFKNHIRLQLQIKVSSVSNGTIFSETNEISKRPLLRIPGHHALFHFKNVPQQIKTTWDTDNKFTGSLNLSIYFGKEARKILFVETMPTNPSLNVFQKMYDQDIGKDVALTTECGEKIKCHSCVLSARSQIFQELFQVGIPKDPSSTIMIRNSSLAELKAFLNYIYKCEVEEAFNDLKLALKLLKLGNQYQIDELLSSMREIFMVSSVLEIGIELALEILIFTKKTGKDKGDDGNLCISQTKRKEWNAIWNDLTLKAVLVLKWYSTNKPQELMSSERYNRLYKETPQIAMELHSKFLQFVSTASIQKKAGKRPIIESILD